LDPLQIFEGEPQPLGLNIQGSKANFSLYSEHATAIYLCLFQAGQSNPDKKIPLRRTQNYWHVSLSNFPDGIEYSFLCEGPYDEKQGLLFNSSEYLSDPYAKLLNTSVKWADRASTSIKKQARCSLSRPKPFDWQGAQCPRIPYQDLLIYEMHVRGFTRHSSSQVSHPGTYLGIIEKIPYLKKLGINAVELMPIFEFDEIICKNSHPDTQHPLVNYWGYNPLHFFAPMRRYASGKDLFSPVEEFRTLVRELHKNGIEVILDVVFNHTGEEDQQDRYVNFRGIDNSVYYLLDSQGKYFDFAGCGNTVNANHPAVLQLILDSLRYWIQEMGVDGFRFDLASIFTRDTKGKPKFPSPLLKAMSSDPMISQVKLIAEAWDAAGLYQIGSFPKLGPSWSEWNGRYRDIVRRFLKGTNGKAGLFANILCGSQWIYSGQTPLASINYITSHDGYSLADLVSYQQKHNWDNGEQNRDGNNQNDSWNCGDEGPSQNPQILALRDRQMRNFLLALLISQGIPMLLMGDEYGHTRKGNNNPYVQDNELNWFLWDQLEKNQKIFHYTASLIRFRKEHPVLRRTQFLTDADIEWHGIDPYQPSWNSSSRLVAFSYTGEDRLYAAFNASFEPVQITLPPNAEWRQLVHTVQDWDQHHLHDPSKGPLITHLTLPPYSALLAKGY